jgi:alpha-tubulin suppressor-like RCC1 family protein
MVFEQITGLPPVGQVAVGAHHACAVERHSEAVWCWGQNGHGQLGDGTFGDSAGPVMVSFILESWQ